MDKKTLAIIIVALVVVIGGGIALFASGSSNTAPTLVSHSFNAFSIDVPEGAEFKEVNKSSGTYYVDANNNLMIIYYQDDSINNETVNDFYTGFGSTDSFKDAGTDGNLRIFNSTNDTSVFTNFVGFNDGNTIIIVGGDNLDVLKQMANSIKLN